MMVSGLEEEQASRPLVCRLEPTGAVRKMKDSALEPLPEDQDARGVQSLHPRVRLPKGLSRYLSH